MVELDQDPLVAWLTSLRQGRYREAEARLRARELIGKPESREVLAAVRILLAWKEALLSRQYAAALELLAADLSPLAAYVSSQDIAEGTKSLLQVIPELEEVDPGPDLEELRRELAPALDCPQTCAEAHNVLGVAAALRQDGPQARLEFEAAVAADPEHYRALTNLGNIRLQDGLVSEAEGLYRRAIAINPQHAVAHNNLAVVLRRQGHLAESVRALRASQRLAQRSWQQRSREQLRQRLGRRGPGQPSGARPAALRSWLSPLLAVLLALALAWRFR